MANVSYIEPQQIRVGDTLTWRRSLADYPAGEGWVLSYTLINATHKITITTTADGNDHVVNVPATTSDDYVAGWYDYFSHVAKGVERYSVGSGRMQVLPNLVAATTLDTRSHARKMLDAIEALLEKRATTEQLGIMRAAFGDRSTDFTHGELLKMRDRYRAEVVSEAQAERLRNGLQAARRVRTRLA
jgi:hypothetical protein